MIVNPVPGVVDDVTTLLALLSRPTVDVYAGTEQICRRPDVAQDDERNLAERHFASGCSNCSEAVFTFNQ